MNISLRHLMLLTSLAAWSAAAGEPFTFRQAIPLADVSGAMGHLAVDDARKRLFVAATGSDSVEVIDLAAGKRVRRLSDCHAPRGLLFLAKPNLLYVANGGNGTVRIYDGATFNILKTIGSLPRADLLRHDPQANRVYVGFGDGALGIIHPLTGVHTATLRLLGHPEGFALDSQGSRIFVNVPAARQVAIVNRPTQSMEEAWMSPQLDENRPMVLDEANHRLFVGCAKPPRLLVLDTASGRVVADQSIADGCDGLFHDGKRNRIYATCGEGYACLIQSPAGDHYQERARIKTAPGAATGAYSPALNELFVAVPARGGQGAEIRVYRTGD